MTLGPMCNLGKTSKEYKADAPMLAGKRAAAWQKRIGQGQQEGKLITVLICGNRIMEI